MRKPLKKLSGKHLRFCDLYAQFIPPAVAYGQAFGKGDGADKHPGNAARLLREPLIQEELKRLLGETDVAGDPLTVAYRRNLVRRELERIAFFRLPNVLNDDGSMKALSELSDDDKAAIEEIVIGEDGKRKCKPHSKTAALAQLVNLDGLGAPKRTELSGPGGGPVQTEDLTQYTDDELLQLQSIQRATEARRPLSDQDRSGD
jgi:hypothetical protein